MRTKPSDKLIDDLRAAVGSARVVSAPEELLVYECDGLPHYKHPPRAVVFPESTEEVSEALRVLSRAGVPFAPRGAGTGLSGGALALQGGILIELARMRQILRLDVENRLAVVQPGLVNAQLSRAVAAHRLHYAPDPSSQASCTIGGNVAENAGGIHCLKYGVTVDHVLGARVVLSDGTIVDLGGAGAESNGFDLLGVFVGSEGTFGIATEITVRLTPLPQAVRTILAEFTDIDSASRAVSSIIASGIIPAALEMVDGATIRAVEASVFAAGLPLDAEAALLVELDGPEAGLDAETERVERICLEQGARTTRRAADEAERKRLWAARKGAFGAMGRLAPDVMIQDAVVPRSRLPEVLAETYRVGAKYRLRLANVFHAGDGNLHPFISFDSRDQDEEQRVKEAGREIVEACVRVGGTITGEHGVGLDKSAYLPLIFDEETLRAMLDVRGAFDPLGICNPGKIIPALRGCGEARAVAASKGKGSKALGGDAGDNTRGSEAVASRPSAFLKTANTTDSRARSLHEEHADKDAARRSHKFSSALQTLSSITGDEHVEETASGAFVVAPGNYDEACEVLRAATLEGWAVVPSGGAESFPFIDTKRGPRVVVSTTRLREVIEHEPADLVVTAQAGLTLARLNEMLAGAGQWLALDPHGIESTLGGVAARGKGGAQSLGYGPPRSHVLGMCVALSGGRRIRVGGRVVKNVAGYDLSKLFVGSHGALGLILELTYRLRPLPQKTSTVVCRAEDWHALLDAARGLRTQELSPVALELVSPGIANELPLDIGGGAHALLARFAGSTEVVKWQAAKASGVLQSHRGINLAGVSEDDSALWQSLQALGVAENESQLIWRASSLPSNLAKLIDAARNSKVLKETLWHAGAGDGRLRVIHRDARGEMQGYAATLEALRREARKLGGLLVVEKAPHELFETFDAWGIEGKELALMRRVKSALDAEGIFSPGRFAFGES